MEEVYNANSFEHASKKIHLKSYFSELKKLGQNFMSVSFHLEGFPLNKINPGSLGAKKV